MAFNVSLGLGNKAQTSIALANIEALGQCEVPDYWGNCGSNYMGTYCGYCIISGEYFNVFQCYGSDWLC